MFPTLFKKSILTTAVANAIAALMFVGPMLLAAAGVTLLLWVVGAGPRWPWFAWMIAAPVVYLCWVILYLSICALGIGEMARRCPKPRHCVVRPGQHPSPEVLGLRTAATCYQNMAMVETLPLARATGRIPWLGTLWLRAYSPALHLGNGVINTGYIIDPDLTEIGDQTVLGGKSVLVAHAVAAREDGAIVFTSAPIKIGSRVTLGGEAYVALGCVIGNDAVLEPRAVAAPFTQIPSGEVWGGNPASFLRKRNAGEIPQPAPYRAAAAPATARAADIPRAMTNSTPAVSIAALRELVVDVLQLTPGEAAAEPSSENCAEWDSLGQVAIAAAVFDRYGVAIDSKDVFRMRTLRDIANLITTDALELAGGGGAGHDLVEATPASAPDLGVDTSATLSDDDIDMLPLMEPQEATRTLAARFDAGSVAARPLRVCIAASFTVQPVAPTLKVWGRAFGLEIECRFADYDQIVQALLDPGGQFAANHDGVNVLLTRPEDLVADAADQSSGRIDDILDALRSYAGNPAPRGQLLVGTLPPVVSAYSEVSQRVAGALRARWDNEIEQLAGLRVFDFGRLVEALGVEQARNSPSEALARAPYAPRLCQRLGIALVRAILATRRAPAKVIALDCDNTLWGGIVGEVGLDAIELGPDGPGRSFQLFQRYLKTLQARGFLLVVVSKNEPHDVREVFENHPGMILRSDDIAAWRVNWEPKSKNIWALAEELRLGVDAFVFVDDDPVARLEVKSLVPGVHVVPLPSDPSRYRETVERLWLFDGPPPTAVDASRTRMMREESRRQEEGRAFRSLDDFLAGLELSVEMGPPVEQEWTRVAQLTQRTNQFSLSLRRYTLEELRSLAADHLVLVLKAQDRFGAYGLVGACILLPPDQTGACEIDTLLMSCRALGRGVEDAFLHGIGAAAARQGASRLVARYVAGPRNAQIRAFLTRHRFTEVESEVFSIPLDELAPLPAHVRFVEREVRRSERTASPAAPRDADVTTLIGQ